MTKSNNISNKEALRDKIHEIHNYLRNNGAGYGMNALKVFNLLYGLKKLEEKDLLDKSNLKRPECEFTYLLHQANQNKDEELLELIKGDVLDSIAISNIRELLFYEIPNTIGGKSLSYLIKEINKITIIEETCNVLLSGKIYEYFIGRDESAISELGAYFTDRHIVDYIYKKVDPNINDDGSINTMIDMFGGSGGFTTGYINYMNNKYKNMNWTENIHNIYHYDMNSDVVKSAGLEIFCLTGELPNMINNVNYQNSFKHEYGNNKYKTIVTNPPYGGDKTKKSTNNIKRDKIIEYIYTELETLEDENKRELRFKQLKDIENKNKQDKLEMEKFKVSLDTSSDRIRKFAKKHKLKGNDKEAVSLILMMDLLDINGTAIGVLKEGVFFNSTYKNIRKCLVENFNVTEVISVPQDQFENTTTKTSILIFNNKEYNEDEKIVFSELKITKYEDDKFEDINGTIYITESKGDIYDVTDQIVSIATKEEIINHKTHSLNGKDYNKIELKIGKDYQLVKLGDICNFIKYKSQKPSSGMFNYYTCSKNIKKCSNGNINGEYILIGTRGTIIEALHYYNGSFGCGDNMLIFNSNTVNNIYIYSILLSSNNQIKNYINGSTIPMITLDQLKNLQIPIPKDEDRITYWVDRISVPYDKKNQKEQKLKILEEKIKDKIKYICENEECEEFKLEELCEFTSGKFKSSDCKKLGMYPFYNGKAIQPDGYSDNYCYDGKEYIIIIKDGGAGAGNYGDQIGMGNVFLVNGKCGFTSHQLALELKNDSINIKYIYYSLKINKNNIMDLAKYSTGLGTITKSDLGYFKIIIPVDLTLITKLEPLFDKVEVLQKKIKKSEALYKQYIEELSNEAIIH